MLAIVKSGIGHIKEYIKQLASESVSVLNTYNDKLLAIVEWLLMILNENAPGLYKELENTEAPQILLSLFNKRSSFTILHERIAKVFLKVFQSNNKSLILAVTQPYPLVYQ